MGMGPKFLCIGAMKSGTTWLHRNLRNHAELWLPPIKELHYLDYCGKDRGGLPLLMRDVCSRRRAGRFFNHHIARIGRGKRPRHLLWGLRYFMLPSNERWYVSLFPRSELVPGECTPAYGPASAEAIERLSKILPDLKLIYLLRNPVHRDWSNIAMRLRRPWRGSIAIDGADATVVERQLESVQRTRASQYIENLERWERFYPREQIFVGFFEQVQNEPEDLLIRILDFIGVEASGEHVPADIRKMTGSGGRYGPIPDRYARLLSERYFDQIVRLHERFHNEYTKGWLDYAEQHADRKPSA
jgi:hypothetical protein